MILHRVILPSLLCWLSLAISAVAAKPNILFILVDDFGSRDLGCYGSSFYETPNMDKLAAQGARFTQAYAAYPRCVPSRFAILTGKHPTAYQGQRDSVHVEPGRDVTFGKALQDVGYTTFYCGKWHLGDGASDPSKVGFSSTKAAGAAGATRSHFAPYTESRGRGGKGGEEKDPIVGLEDAPKDEYLTDRLTEETMKFIEANKERPFCAVLAHYAVHTPLEAKTDARKRYADKLATQKLPETLYEKESAGENLTVQNNPTYAAMVENVDQSLGRIIEQLKRLKLEENTIIILTGDHGGLSARGNNREVATTNRPLRAGKGHLYEGGIRVPLIFCWSHKIKAGSVVDNPVVLTDLFPTFLALAEQPLRPSDHKDGISFANLLLGQRPTDAQNGRIFCWHNPSPRPQSTADIFSSAIRIGPLKLIDFPTENRVELYDLKMDPAEAKNLSLDRAKDTADLLEQLNAWRKTVGATTQPKTRVKDAQP